MSVSRVRTVVSTNWLREQLGTSVQKPASRKLRVLDTTFVLDRHADSYNDSYKKSHIPQSVYFNLYKCTPEKPGITVGWPDVNCFTNYVQSLGVWPDTHVVAYDRNGPVSAYRTWWQFRALGHRKISVLDGGLKKWIADGFEVTTEEPDIERSDYVAKLDKNLFRSFEDIMGNFKSKKEQLVDSRPLDHPLITDKEISGGFIIGSKHVSFFALFNEDGTIKSDSELKAMFDGAGVDLNKPLLVSCLRGLTACGVAGAAHILGKDVPVYQGSWQEFRMIGPEEYKGRVE